jgi:hypothetical protein
MRKFVPAIALSAALAVPAAHAAELELSLSDDDAQILVTTPGDQWGMRDSEVGAGIFFNEDDDLVGTLQLLSTNRVSPSLRFGVGVQGYLADLDRPNETAGAIAVGGNAGIGLASQIPVRFVLEGWIAPNILSFSGVDRVTELAARVEADVSERASVFVGWRNLEMDLDGGRGDYEVEDGVNFGLRFGF